MRLAKIKNRYLFNSDNPNGNHTYGVYYDKPTKRYRAVGLTHLYVKDNKRFIQIKQGKIMVMKFKDFDTPSGVKNTYFDKNVSGGKIDLTHPDVLSISKYLSKNQSQTIKNFAQFVEK